MLGSTAISPTLPHTQAGHEHDLLLTLEEISQVVSHSHDLRETLDNICQLIQKRFGTAVCSLYLFNPEGSHLVLAATVGLRAESIGRVRMRPGEGLTGLVAESLAPVMEPNAQHHPHFKYFPEAGEEPFQSFLGVPLLVGGTLKGVLVVQSIESRHFSTGEARMLKTVAAQLSSLVTDAWWLEQMGAMAHGEVAQEKATGPLSGLGLSPGVGAGLAYVLDSWDTYRQKAPRRADDPLVERERLERAMAQAREELKRQEVEIAALVGEDQGAILQAQRMILQDRGIERDLLACLDRGSSAEAAILDTLDHYVAAFSKVTTAVLQERVYDIKDVFHRVLWHLVGGRPGRPSADLPVILVAREASVMELFAVERSLLAGVVVEQGGPQSHAAILARSLGLPMVGKVEDFARVSQPGQWLKIDGFTGQIDPDTRPDESPQEAQPHRDLPIISPPPLRLGIPILEANINLLCEVDPALRDGAAGVGLFRSEFLFLARRSLPTEEEQHRIYSKLVTGMQGRPVCVRTFDLRPDKLASVSLLGKAGQGYDWRLVLDSPPLQRLFREQARAILRASTLGPVRLLIPLVSCTELVDLVHSTLADARTSLRSDGLAFSETVQTGLMIESAAAIPLAKRWMADVDFLALGTNDLAASALAFDRDNPVGTAQLDFLHPGFLGLLEPALAAAHQHGKAVSVCGEMAADPRGAIALAALGVDRLSVPVKALRPIHQVLARLEAGRLAEIAAALRKATSRRAVVGLIEPLLPPKRE
ncbi:MAG: GAF domain-containing protein [Planctomycetota bacterium]|nr:GAF domain-containing protein [Planctomycetota bacterium]